MYTDQIENRHQQLCPCILAMRSLLLGSNFLIRGKWTVPGPIRAVLHAQALARARPAEHVLSPGRNVPTRFFCFL